VEKENDINKNIETKINEKDFENNVKEYIKIYNGIK
jgi:hypothetical protein